MGGKVYRIKTDSDFTFEVAADCVRRQTGAQAGVLVLGPVVVMLGTFWVWPVGLKGVRPPVDEEIEVRVRDLS